MWDACDNYYEMYVLDTTPIILRLFLEESIAEILDQNYKKKKFYSKIFLTELFFCHK